MLDDATSPEKMGKVGDNLVLMASIMVVKNMVQSAIATSAAIIPPLTPPPVWNLMPLPCMPMLTGHNCFGAVLYPITFSDSLIADVTDSIMDSVITSFPELYANRVGGKTADDVYLKCFQAYMSMACASLFPVCTTFQARNEYIPFLGRMPICFPLCLAVLYICPGFTAADISGFCDEASLPPLCALAWYRKSDPNVVPKQLDPNSNQEGYGECPKYDPDIDIGQDPTLYDQQPYTDPQLQ